MQERRDWNLETHNVAIKALTKIESHELECARRYADWRDAMQAVQSKLGSIELKIAGIVGGLIVLRELFAEGFKFIRGG